jgi:hypothetical protein
MVSREIADHKDTPALNLMPNNTTAVPNQGRLSIKEQFLFKGSFHFRAAFIGYHMVMHGYLKFLYGSSPL